MRKILLTLSLFSMLAFCGAANLLKNPGFDYGRRINFHTILPGWSISDANNSAPLHRIDEKGGVNGSRCAVIEISQEGQMGFFHPDNVLLKPDSKYRISADVIFRRKSPKSNFSINVTKKSTTGEYLGPSSISSKEIQPSENWQHAEMTFLTSQDEKNGYIAEIKFAMSGPGYVKFDNVRLEKIEQEECTVEYYPTSVVNDGIFRQIAGELAELHFYIYKAGKRDGLTLALDMPEDISLWDALPLRESNDNSIEYSQKKENGRTICTISLPPQLVQPDSKHTDAQDIGLGILLKSMPTSSSGELKWRLLDGKTEVKAQTIKLDILQCPEYKLPKRFSLYTWYGSVHNSLKADKAREYLLWNMRSGIRGGGITAPHLAPICNEIGFLCLSSFWYEVPEKCMTLMTTEKKCSDFIKQRFDSISAFKTPILNWNYEPFGTYEHFCPRCRKAFEAFSGKSLADTDDAQSVAKKYPEEYFKFRSSQHEFAVKEFCNACRARNIEPSLCSFTMKPDMSKADIEELEKRMGSLTIYGTKYLSYYMPQVYQRQEMLWKYQQAAVDFSKNIIMCHTSDERCGGKSCPYAILTPDNIKMNTLITAAQGTSDLMLFVGSYTLDGAQLIALRKVLNDISIYEEFFLLGAKQEIDKIYGGEEIIGFLRKHPSPGKWLFGVMNTDPYETKYAAFKLPENLKLFRACDEIKGCSLKFSGNTFMLELPPSSYRFFYFSAVPKVYNQIETLPVFKASEYLNKFTMPSQGKYNISGTGETQENLDTLSISCDSVVWDIDIADGAVLTIDKHQLSRDLIWLPKHLRWNKDNSAKYQFNGVQLNGDKLEISFSHNMKNPEMKAISILKKYVLSPNGNVETQITLKNNGYKELSFAFWNHNEPNMPL